MFDWINREKPEELMERLRHNDPQLVRDPTYFIRKMGRAGLPGFKVLHKNFNYFKDVDLRNGTTVHVTNIWISAQIAKRVGDEAYRYAVQTLASSPSDGWPVRVLCYSVGLAPVTHSDFTLVTFSDPIRSELAVPLANSLSLYGDGIDWYYGLRLLAMVMLPEQIGDVVSTLQIDRVRRLISIKSEQSSTGDTNDAAIHALNEALENKIRQTIGHMLKAMEKAVPTLERRDLDEIHNSFASSRWPGIPEPFRCASLSELIEKVNGWSL